jgi:hypothetical protein
MVVVAGVLLAVLLAVLRV